MDKTETKHVKRDELAKRAIQCALSEEGRAKRAYKDPKPTLIARNRESGQGERHHPQQPRRLKVLQ